MLVSFGGENDDVVWGGGVVDVGSCLEVVEVSEVVEVVLGVTGVGLEERDDSIGCDVVVVVEVLESTGTDGTNDEGLFWRGMN